MSSADDEFDVRQLGITIHCPKCNHEMVDCRDSLRLAQSPTGAMLECGKCAEITQWRIKRDPFAIEQVVPLNWGKTV